MRILRKDIKLYQYEDIIIFTHMSVEIKMVFTKYLFVARLKDRVTHVKIHGRGKKYDVGGGKQFDSIEDLIEYYKKCLLVDDKGIAIYLYQVCQ